MDKPSNFKGWHRVLMIIIPWAMVIFLFQSLGLILSGAGLKSHGDNLTTLQNVIVMLCLTTGTLLLIWMFRRVVDKEPFISVGFQVKNRGRDILYGLLIGFLIMGLGFGLLLLLKQIEVQSINFNAGEILLNLLLFALVAINEESIMRGYVLNNLMLSMNKYLALLISSVVFSLLHLANPHFSLITFLVIILSGIILGLSYIYTRNLWFPIALHLSWNFFQGTIFGFNVSGTDDYSLIGQFRPEDNLINGGSFGFEGSLLAICFIVLCTLFVWKVYYIKDNITETTLPSET
jgi:membrane protease YdiL (CAAX protease family)